MTIENPLAAVLAATVVPRQTRIHDMLVYWEGRRGPEEAVADSHRRLTWSALAGEVDAIAAALVTAGVGRGDRVAMLAAPSVDFWRVFLAIVSIGGIWVGLNPKHTLEELDYVLTDAKPALVIFPDACEGRDLCGERAELLLRHGGAVWVRSSSDDWLAWIDQGAQLQRHELELRRASVLPVDAALLVYTSGSTGRPKGALLPHHAVSRAAWVHAAVWHAEPFRILNNLPVNHVGCVCDIACTTLAAGGFQVFMERFDAAGSIDTIEREKLTVWGQVPTQFQLSLATNKVDSADLSSLQLILWSGARAPRDLIVSLSRLAPWLSTSYGMTETVGSVTLAPRTADVSSLDGSIGWPDPGRAVRLSEDGEILVKDAFLMAGYLGREEATAEAFVDGWFRTGDTAIRRPDGALSISGRTKEMFKSGGYNIYPREVEEAIEAFPGVESAVVVPVADSIWGEIGHGFVVMTTGASFDEEALRIHLRSRLANYKQPKRLTVLSVMPMLAVGKIDRAALRRRAAEISA